jgi:gamma-glutamyl-gamma-aminobutyraldehyde dehydrogenase
MVTFTGSNEVGRLFLEYAAQSNMKRITLECGGKSPQIIFEDAGDLEYVAGEVLNAAFWNMGENCSCGSRLIVHAGIQERLLKLLKKGLQNWHCGDPMDPETKMGPMVEKAHFDKVKALIESGCKQGATILDNEPPDDSDLAGYFIQPLIFSDVRNDMEIAQEEIFGPVLSVLPFNNEEEAIELANDSKYGLAASLYTKNIDRAMRVSRALRAGTVSVNCFAEGSIATPFGGYKESGFGGRDNGLEAFDQYCEIKTIWIKLEGRQR